MWFDLDNDGFLDLYLGSETGPNQLYRNNGNGTFKNISRGSGTDLSMIPKSLVTADYDHDGYADLFVSNYQGDSALLHIDLHETTDSDESEFRPALAARDGVAYEPGEIPDGFYLVDDTENPQPAFQQAIIEAVAKVTHIAPADAKGEIIGSPVVAPGVIRYPLKKLGLCAGITNARYTSTTEVYPDSPRATPAQCNDAQVAAVCAAIDFALAAG